MTKQTKEKEEPRRVGPKFARSVIPENFQIRRPISPMADLLDEASRKSTSQQPAESLSNETSQRVVTTPTEITTVDSTTVKKTAVSSDSKGTNLPELATFLDEVLPFFPPARQAILLRLYRWSEGAEKTLIVSTPKLAAKTNMDEKVCRNHLHALIVEGFVVRSMDGGQIARFGGSDRSARGLILSLSAKSLFELVR